MSGIDELKLFVSRNRHRLTPKQALDLDEKVVKTWNPDHPEAPASTEPTEDEVVANELLGNASWYTENTGSKIPPKRLYETPTVPMTEGAKQPGEGSV